MQTLLLDLTNWDLVVDAFGNIAAASDPYALAQDAASAIKLFQGELYYDTTQGVPYFTKILGQFPNINLIKALLAEAAATVPEVAEAVVAITAFSNRVLSGIVEVTSAATGQVSQAPFTTTNPWTPAP